MGQRGIQQCGSQQNPVSKIIWCVTQEVEQEEGGERAVWERRHFE